VTVVMMPTAGMVPAMRMPSVGMSTMGVAARMHLLDLARRLYRRSWRNHRCGRRIHGAKTQDRRNQHPAFDNPAHDFALSM